MSIINFRFSSRKNGDKRKTISRRNWRYITLLLYFHLLGQTLTAQKTTDLRLVLSDVQFSAEKSNIGAQAAAAIGEVAALMKKNPAVTLEIGAHTDASGSASYNLRLSQQRAQSVYTHLVKKGVAAKRLKAKGYGETQPLNRCRRGVRCSEAEKRENRRVELRVSGLPADASGLDEWLALGGLTTKKPTGAPEIPKMPEMKPATAYRSDAANTSPAENETLTVTTTGQQSGDFFPELRSGTKKEPRSVAPPEPRQEPRPDDHLFVPKPLPATFIGYTIEVACPDKPYPAGNSLLRKYDPVFLRQQAGGAYCYYIGAFHTRTEAGQFLRTEALSKFPNAQVVAFSNNEKTYFNH